jgi:ABC-type dipeptide/oligopeptide/nickel transport system permease subunit
MGKAEAALRPAAAGELQAARPARRRWLLPNRGATIGAIVIAILVLGALLAPLIAPYDPLKTEGTAILQGPSAQHPLGTDSLGRDTLSRIIYGARVSLLVGVSAVALALLVGASLGLVAGYFGGAVDDLVMRGTDVLMAIPGIVLALVVLAATGPSLLGVVLAIAVGGVPGDIRLARSQTLYERGLDYVAAARAIGSSSGRLMYRHILPNIGSVLIVRSTTSLGAAILVESGLSFLGLGVPPPTPTWGAMISEGRQFIFTAAHVGLIPGLVIMVTVLAFNVTGDGLRDVLDPRSSVRTQS